MSYESTPGAYVVFLCCAGGRAGTGPRDCALLFFFFFTTVFCSIFYCFRGGSVFPLPARPALEFLGGGAEHATRLPGAAIHGEGVGLGWEGIVYS